MAATEIPRRLPLDSSYLPGIEFFSQWGVSVRPVCCPDDGHISKRKYPNWTGVTARGQNGRSTCYRIGPDARKTGFQALTAKNWSVYMDFKSF